MARYLATLHFSEKDVYEINHLTSRLEDFQGPSDNLPESFDEAMKRWRP